MHSSATINSLVIDDEPSICWALERILTEEGHHVSTASSAEAGMRVAETERPDLIFLDVRLPKADGISTLPRLRKMLPNTPVVVMTAFGDVETAIAAVREGAAEYLTKPFKLDDAVRLSRKLTAPMMQRQDNTSLRKLSNDDTRLVGQSAAMQHAFREIALVANSELSVLITGETGTGKELVARTIHQNSSRRDNPFVIVTPAAVQPQFIESELFGHVKGAFSEATEDRAGLFEAAEGGTVFLDEIGDLPLDAQIKLLRVLERREYCKVGDSTIRMTNVRFITATHRNLDTLVQEGAFRKDLLYRIKGVHIHLPPLSERGDDIRLLTEYFLLQMGYPKSMAFVDPELKEALTQRPWPGNVRELRNVVQHAAFAARGRKLSVEDLPNPSANINATIATSTVAAVQDAVVAWIREQLSKISENETDLYDRFLHIAQPPLLEQVLEYTAGNKARAAELLGIHRSTLRDKLKHQ